MSTLSQSVPPQIAPQLAAPEPGRFELVQRVLFGRPATMAAVAVIVIFVFIAVFAPRAGAL